MERESNKLAIVIPVYKSAFLQEALNSIASQTNKNFTLYIGNDNSPEDIYSTVKKYENDLDIIYKKFDENLGNISIVKHWKRCVEMTNAEEWIWLFSDDDMMSEDCVELFFQAIEKTSGNYDLYRFNCSIIDKAGKQLTNKSGYPEIQSSFEFLISRLTYQYHSYIVNCIFSRTVFLKNNGFVDFKAAWAADDATWILYGQDKKIFTLNVGEVKWRQSSINISGNTKNLQNRRNKYEGTAQFISWVYNWSLRNKIQVDDKIVIKWFFTMLESIGYRYVSWTYIKSKTFRTFFLKGNYVYQLKSIRSNLHRKF